MPGLPNPGDVVAVHRGGKLAAGTVTGVVTIDDLGDTIIDVDTIPAGLMSYYPHEVTVVPTPAAGQRWRCLTDPDLMLVVESASGPVADCHTMSGRWIGNVVLPGFYELVVE